MVLVFGLIDLVHILELKMILKKKVKVGVDNEITV